MESDTNFLPCCLLNDDFISFVEHFTTRNVFDTKYHQPKPFFVKLRTLWWLANHAWLSNDMLPLQRCVHVHWMFSMLSLLLQYTTLIIQLLVIFPLNKPFATTNFAMFLQSFSAQWVSSLLRQILYSEKNSVHATSRLWCRPLWKKRLLSCLYHALSLFH